jgi:CTP:molybdopterin cytidylyltransferase MocA
MPSAPVVIVLAAGAGSRFEGPGHKLTQALGPTTVLGATLQQVLASSLRLVVVTTRDLRDMVKGWVATQDVVVVPSGSDGAGEHLGMGYSIAAGVRARGDAAGWLVMPGDMPLVRPTTLRAVAAALAGHPVAYAQFQGQRPPYPGALSGRSGGGGRSRCAGGHRHPRGPAVGPDPSAGVRWGAGGSAATALALKARPSAGRQSSINPCRRASASRPARARSWMPCSRRQRSVRTT